MKDTWAKPKGGRIKGGRWVLWQGASSEGREKTGPKQNEKEKREKRNVTWSC